MKIDPVVVSLVALVVSIVSLIITAFRAAVDRRLQWEQMRGSFQSQLTSRGVEILAIIEELRRVQGDDTIALTDKLIRIVEGIVEVRRKLKRMESPPPFSTSALTQRLAPIKSDLDDAEPVFDSLRSAVKNSQFSAASRIADGLLNRFYAGSDESSGEHKGG